MSMELKYWTQFNKTDKEHIHLLHNYNDTPPDMLSSYIGNTDNIDHQTDILQKINDQEVKALYPLIFFYAIILMIGVIGNAVVLLVYTYQYKRSPARMFILFLASIDFSICLFGLPYHMIDLTHPYTFTNAISCKILTFIISLFFHMSIFGLIVIAVDRYLKICRPLSSFQMSYFGKRMACALASIAAVMFAWPNIVLYGPSEMETFYQNVSGHACFFTTEYTETIYPLVFTMVTLTLCLTSTAFLIVSYSLICHQIITRYRGPSRFGKYVYDEGSCTDEVTMKNFTVPIEMKYSPVPSKECLNPSEQNIRDDSRRSSDTSKERRENASRNRELFPYSNSNGSLIVANETHYSGSKIFTVGQAYDRNKTSVEKVKSSSESPESGRRLLLALRETTLGKQMTTSGCKCDINGRSDEPETEHLLYIPHKESLGSPTRRCSEQMNILPKKEVKWKRSQSLVLPNRNMYLNNCSDDNGLRINQSSCVSIPSSSRSSVKMNKQNMMSKQHFKITKIMLTVSSVFILSHAPAFVITILSTVDTSFWDDLTESETIFCEFLLRFYLVNNICNPFIYGFWDKRFKKEVRFTFRKLKFKLKTFFQCL
ncbi:uncharacterized protein LOC128206869 [Mya arenaria]|uniref:uncharacterized protein LOC128206869 n=1 Tax=Mya arenaria TaxID=6604 RepID=UPI0022DF648D|nr:uncharacterized protein LOC128206869 [Mya arenaria]